MHKSAIIIVVIACSVICSTYVYAQQKSWMIGPFAKQQDVNPCLQPKSTLFYDPVLKKKVGWEAQDVFNPAAVVKDGKVHLLYRAEDTVKKYAGTSRIGLANSRDGMHFKTYTQPVLYPQPDTLLKFEAEGGVEDPRLVQDEMGVYYMTYTAYDGTTARLFIATSKDLKHWKKYGSIFRKAENGKYMNYWSKSGSIVSEVKNGNMIAVKIEGKYWMYWGESNIYAATSDNLIDWTPILETDPAKKQYDSLRKYEAFKIVFGPRHGKFDSELVEPGPPAMVTSDGIVFIYNSRNSPSFGDKSLPNGTYAAGQILLDKTDPLKVLDRCENYFIRPDMPYEITGQVNNVCFVEGLVQFNNEWFLYYGTADSKIAVATSEIK
jgi:predicted GH43/DUF377 family glycosyl hydrolase